MAYSPNYAILYLKISVSQYIVHYFILIYGCLVWFYSRKSDIDRIIKLLKSCNRIINFSDFNSRTDSPFSELKLLKVNYIFSLSELLFMFDFIKENIPEELKRLIIFNKSVHSYETRPSQIFHISKGKTSRFSLNALNYVVLKYGLSFSTRFCTKKQT